MDIREKERSIRVVVVIMNDLILLPLSEEGKNTSNLNNYNNNLFNDDLDILPSQDKST